MSMAKQITLLVKTKKISLIDLFASLRNQIIMAELKKHEFNITDTAESLNMKRTTLQEILRRQGLNKIRAALKNETDNQ